MHRTTSDNGGCPSWDLTLPIGWLCTRSHLEVLAPLGRAPCRPRRPPTPSRHRPGGNDGYTITIHNPSLQAVALDAITHTLPAASATDRIHDRSDHRRPGDRARSSVRRGRSRCRSGDASIDLAVTAASTSRTSSTTPRGRGRVHGRFHGDTAPMTVAAMRTHTPTVTTAGNGTGTVTSATGWDGLWNDCSAGSDDATPVDSRRRLASFDVSRAGRRLLEHRAVLGHDGRRSRGDRDAHGVETDLPGAPTYLTATSGNGSALVGWTASVSDGGSPIHSYTVTCTATANPDDVQSRPNDGSTTSRPAGGLTNDVEYTCVVTATTSTATRSHPQPPRRSHRRASDAQFSTSSTHRGRRLE